MAHEVASGGGGPDLVIIIVAVSLVVVIVANTALLVANTREYKWWYGLVKLAFYLGSFALTLATGGASAGIASISTFLGMELNKLAQNMHNFGVIPRLSHAFGFGRQTKEGKDTAER